MRPKLLFLHHFFVSYTNSLLKFAIFNIYGIIHHNKKGGLGMYLNWAYTNSQHETAYEKLDTFFEKLYEESERNINGATITYRESQQRFASTVMEAIKDRNIILIEAGVGTGKSFGYLIPVFYTLNNVTTFDKVIISTSTIALQEQLLKDVEYVSSLLGIKIKAWVSKGINNYACLKRINDKIKTAAANDDTDTIELLTDLRKTMLTKSTCDKSRLPAVPSSLWNSIRVCGSCDKCGYRATCLFAEHQAHIRNMPIIITNHTQLSNMIKYKSPELAGSSLLVVDEAHKLEEQIRLANQEELDFKEIFNRLEATRLNLMYIDYDDYSYEFKQFQDIYKTLKSNLFELAKALRSNGRTTYKKQNNRVSTNIEDVDKVNFSLDNERIKMALASIVELIKNLINLLTNLDKKRYFEANLQFFKKIDFIFRDMLAGNNSKRVYWIKFISDDKVTLVHTIKDVKSFTDKIYESNIPVVFTSATLTTKGDYEAFKNSTGIPTERLVQETPISSPFDYGANSLFYYDKEAVNPTTKDRESYIADMAARIKDLIEVTEGKALVLFTSKSDMVAIYNIVNSLGLSQKLILQNSDDISKCKNEFENNTNSCLFATGAFWEGIDFPGKTLSNLIIVKLPFPVQDPIVEYKKRGLPRNQSWKVDLDEMLMKMAQGTGRLIRSVNDTGIVCCLDSRTPRYLDYLSKSLPFTQYTDDSEILIDFANSKILGKSSENPDKNLQLKTNS